MNITEFKEGDIIVRTGPARLKEKIKLDLLFDPEADPVLSKTKEPKELNITLGYSRDYMGLPFEFLGIYNNMIYLRSAVNVPLNILGTKIGQKLFYLPMDQWDRNWKLFEIPPSISMVELEEMLKYKY